MDIVIVLLLILFFTGLLFVACLFGYLLGIGLGADIASGSEETEEGPVPFEIPDYYEERDVDDVLYLGNPKENDCDLIFVLEGYGCEYQVGPVAPGGEGAIDFEEEKWLPGTYDFNFEVYCMKHEKKQNGLMGRMRINYKKEQKI